MLEIERDLRILEALESNPELTQAGLAAQLGVAVGSVNWYLKRLIRKGYIKATRLQRRKLRYLVTPKGLALKGRLTVQYIKASLGLYKRLRQSARLTLRQVRAAGWGMVRVSGPAETADILRLTCLELGMRVVAGASTAVPRVYPRGEGFAVDWTGTNSEGKV